MGMFVQAAISMVMSAIGGKKAETEEGGENKNMNNLLGDGFNGLKENFGGGRNGPKIM